jgi:hypothetical protein
MTFPGCVLRVEGQHKPLLQQTATSALPQEWAEKYSRGVVEIGQLRKALEDSAAELQLSRRSQLDYMARFESLQVTVSSQEVQMQAILSQSAVEKSAFLQEKEHLQLLFDKQQQLCVGLTSQVVALTASSESLRNLVDSNAIQQHLEKEQFIRDMNQKDTAFVAEQQKCSEALSCLQTLEKVCVDKELKLESLRCENVEQAQKIEAMTRQLQAALSRVAEQEQSAALYEVHCSGTPAVLRTLRICVYLLFYVRVTDSVLLCTFVLLCSQN